MLPAEGLGSQGPKSKAGPCPSGRNTSSTATDLLFQLVFTVLTLSFPIFFQALVGRTLGPSSILHLIPLDILPPFHVPT